ncbi:hypothetical protein LTR95_009615 [Oleoguttula sp. CCFEE 5521]
MASNGQSSEFARNAPRSPDLSSSTAHRPQSPDLSGLGAPRFEGGYNPHRRSLLSSSFNNDSFGAGARSQPTSVPQHPYQQHPQFDMPPRSRMKSEADVHMQDAQPSYPIPPSNGFSMGPDDTSSAPTDPTHGVTLKTSFPVARIKRIMQADEDIGKVAQVTPHAVSRALELFMIKLITASAEQARGPTAASGTSKGPRRVLAQHMKRAVQEDKTFDFLEEIIGKVPDAPTKAKKEAGSDSEEVKPKKRGKKRKESGEGV